MDDGVMTRRDVDQFMRRSQEFSDLADNMKQYATCWEMCLREALSWRIAAQRIYDRIEAG